MDETVRMYGAFIVGVIWALVAAIGSGTAANENYWRFWLMAMLLNISMVMWGIFMVLAHALGMP